MVETCQRLERLLHLETELLKSTVVSLLLNRGKWCGALENSRGKSIFVELIYDAMIIRQERPEDYRAVEELTREAFWNVYRPGCTEHFVLNQYRNSPDFIPELDFVMEEDGRIIGHVMFSTAQLLVDGIPD